MKRPLRFLLFILIFCLVVLAKAAVLYWLWNWLVPDMFHGPAFTSYGQALAMVVIARILFGGFGKGGFGGPPWMRRREFWKQRMEQKLAGLTPEERKKFMDAMGGCGWGKSMCGSDDQSSRPATQEQKL